MIKIMILMALLPVCQQGNWRATGWAGMDETPPAHANESKTASVSSLSIAAEGFQPQHNPYSKTIDDINVAISGSQISALSHTQDASTDDRYIKPSSADASTDDRYIRPSPENGGTLVEDSRQWYYVQGGIAYGLWDGATVQIQSPSDFIPTYSTTTGFLYSSPCINGRCP